MLAAFAICALTVGFCVGLVIAWAVERRDLAEAARIQRQAEWMKADAMSFLEELRTAGKGE